MSKDPRQEKPGTPPTPPKKEGWIEKLADRSAGLPGSESTEKDSGKSAWSYAGKGLQFAVTTALFALIGWYADRRFGWTPWGMIGFSVVGFIGGLYLLIKEALNDQK
jgi:F0F1-type ATP synthase assembly protein I